MTDCKTCGGSGVISASTGSEVTNSFCPDCKPTTKLSKAVPNTGKRTDYERLAVEQQMRIKLPRRTNDN